jgi:hypothetical protein
MVLTSAAWAGCLQDASRIIQKFDFQGSRVQAALTLGQKANVCLAMRNLRRSAFLEQVNLNIVNANPIQILQRIFAGREVLVVPSDEGIVRIFRPSTEPSLFDHRIADFNVPRAPLLTLATGIRLRLEHELHPEIQGFAGRYSPGDHNDLVGPFDRSNTTVAGLLDLIVSHSKGASWIALVPDSAATQSIPPHMWIIIEYSRPVADYNSLLSQAGAQYPENSKSR